MRKYVVPIVALAGIALLIPQANAVDLIIKSRAIPKGGAGSLPVIVRNVSKNELWGIDAGLTFSNTALKPAVAEPFTGNTKTVGTAPNDTAGFDPNKDVTVSGSAFVGTAPQPSVYFGYVRGATGIKATGTGQVPVGLLKLSIPADATVAVRDVINITTASYNVKNTGTDAGSTRDGATAATSLGTSGAAVEAESVVMVDALSAVATAVPLHKVAVGKPGDPSGDGGFTIADVSILNGIIAGVAGAKTDYRAIAGDVAPSNGYVPGTDLGGTTGLGYGDGNISISDVSALKGRIANVATSFPAAE
jgi:hypothetical protein